MIWTIEYDYPVYNGGDDAHIYVVDSIHFSQQAAEDRRIQLEEEHENRVYYIYQYTAESGSQEFLQFNS